MSVDGEKKLMAVTERDDRKEDDDKGGRGQVTAFYIETLVLAAVFLMVIVVLAQIFSLAVRMSGRAEDLTCAVRLAENAAEAVAASKSAEELAFLLDENGNAGLGEDGCVYAAYDRTMNPESGGVVQVEATWEPKNDGCVESVITVCRAGDSEPIYTLTTAVYVMEEEGEMQSIF